MKATLFMIDGPWLGRLAIVPRPRGGDWLEDKIAAWRRAGIEVMVSLLTPEEADELNLADEKKPLPNGRDRLLFVADPGSVSAVFRRTVRRSHRLPHGATG